MLHGCWMCFGCDFSTDHLSGVLVNMCLALHFVFHVGVIHLFSCPLWLRYVGFQSRRISTTIYMHVNKPLEVGEGWKLDERAATNVLNQFRTNVV